MKQTAAEADPAMAPGPSSGPARRKTTIGTTAAKAETTLPPYGLRPCVPRGQHLSTAATAGQRPTVAVPSVIRHGDVEVAALCLDRHAADPYLRHAHTTAAF